MHKRLPQQGEVNLADQDCFSWNQIETWLQDMFDLSKWFTTVRGKTNLTEI